MAGAQPTKKAEKASVVKSLRDQFPLDILLRLTGLKRSTFFYHLPEKVDKNAAIVQKLVEVYQKNDGNYGYRRITLELRLTWLINHKKVLRLMQLLGLKGKSKRRKYRSYQGEVGKIADNLLQQDFHATAPNQKWVTDITELKCAEGKLYFSPIKDLFNGEIIAYDVARCPNFEQITENDDMSTIPVVAPFLISQCYNHLTLGIIAKNVVAPFLISQCYNAEDMRKYADLVVAPFLISQCYNMRGSQIKPGDVVAPFLISQCYNWVFLVCPALTVVAPFLISQCYNQPSQHHHQARVVAPFLISQCYNLKVWVNLLKRVVAPFLISQCYNRLSSLKSELQVVAPFLISQCYNY